MMKLHRMAAPLLLAVTLVATMLGSHGHAGPAVRPAAAPDASIASCPPTQAPTPYGPSGTITDPRPTFSWSAVAGAETYTLYVLRISDGA